MSKNVDLYSIKLSMTHNYSYSTKLSMMHNYTIKTSLLTIRQKMDRNSSPSCTNIRFAQTHVCPALRNFAASWKFWKKGLIIHNKETLVKS